MRKQSIKYRVVYAIRCLPTGKMYVGSAETYWNRCYSHRTTLRASRHHNSYLQKAWDKYGEATFVFGVIEELSPLDNIAQKEQYWMDFFDVCNRLKGFNIYPNARSSKGHKVSEVSKRKMSEAKKGKMWTPEIRLKMMLADRSNHAMIGKTGDKHFKSKPIIRMDISGGLIDEWPSINMCAVSCGLHKSNIIDCLKGRIKQVKGFLFKYKAA